MGLDGRGRNCLFKCCRGTQHFRTGGCGDYCQSEMHNVDYRRISPLLGLNFPFCPTQKHNISTGMVGMICSCLAALAVGLSMGTLTRGTQCATFPFPCVPRGCWKEEAGRGSSWEV